MLHGSDELERRASVGWSLAEFEEKLGKVRSLMQAEALPNLAITGQVNFTWLTGGRGYISAAAERACGDLLITDKTVYLLANNIETDRLLAEELAGLPIEQVCYEWWDSGGAEKKLREITGGAALQTDIGLGVKFARLRWDLSPQDQLRYRDTGACVAAALDEVAYGLRLGQSEQELATWLRQESLARGVAANVALVAVDERALQYRHPLPTEKKLARYALLAVAGQKHGLHASATRLVHFGETTAELKQRHQAVAVVDAAFISATRPGRSVGEVFAAGLRAYREVGFADEWQRHHQGGMAGYMGREIRATTDSRETIRAGQAFAWNPSILGTKSEDTFLVNPGGNMLVTQSARFPRIQVSYGDIRLERCDILIR